MKQLLSLLLATYLALPAQATDCSKPVTALEQGAPAPCKGYLFTPEKQKEVQLMNEDYALQKDEIQLKDLKIKSYVEDQKNADSIIAKEREQSELWRKRAEESTLLLTKKEDSQGRRDWLMVILGVAITVGAGFAVGQASK
jgi:hypothetical protein